MNDLRERINTYLRKHGVYMNGVKLQGLFREILLGCIVLEDGVTSVQKLRAAIPKRLPRNTEIDYFPYSDESVDDGMALIFKTQERVKGDEEAKLRRGIERIRKKYEKEFGTTE
jgi:hypothetical protein